MTGEQWSVGELTLKEHGDGEWLSPWPGVWP